MGWLSLFGLSNFRQASPLHVSQNMEIGTLVKSLVSGAMSVSSWCLSHWFWVVFDISEISIFSTADGILGCGCLSYPSPFYPWLNKDWLSHSLFYFHYWNGVSCMVDTLEFFKKTYFFIFIFSLLKRQRKRSSILWLFPQMLTTYIQDWAMLEAAVLNSVWVSLMDDRDPSTWAITCCVPGCASAGSWIGNSRLKLTSGTPGDLKGGVTDRGRDLWCTDSLPKWP